MGSGGERESNFELLRILAMLAIIAWHFVSQSGIRIAGHGVLPILLSSAGRLSVDIFLLIGCWFMVGSRFRPERIVRLYAEVFFYSVPLTLVLVSVGEAGGARNVIQGLFPFFGRPVWFATAYISLIVLTPFLNRVLEWPRPVLNRLVALLFLFFCIVSTVPQFTPTEYLADFAWFVTVYLFVGWYRRGGFGFRLGGPVVCLLAAGAVYAGMCALELTPLASLAVRQLDNIRSLPDFLCAVLVFNAFRQLDLGRVPAINFFARSAFAVYIVHQVPAFRAFEWSLFRPEELSHGTTIGLSLGIVGVALTVYVVLALLDHIRLRFIEPRYMASRPVRALLRRIEDWYRAALEV